MFKFYSLLLTLFSIVSVSLGYVQIQKQQAEPARAKINAHCLDITKGLPAQGIHVTLEFLDAEANGYRKIGETFTDAGGHADDIIEPTTEVTAGIYRLTFYAKSYFGETRTFYDHIPVIFEVPKDQTDQDFHIPILLSAYGYSTYRGF